MVSVSSPIALAAICFISHLSPFLLLCLAAGNDSKRLTDHNDADGCRPVLNIDVMRIIAVCKTAAQLKAAVKKLGAKFGGCGRIKVRTVVR